MYCSSPKNFFKLATGQEPLPDVVDLRPWDSKVESQLDLGSCTANAVANAYELMTLQLYPEQFVELSRIFIYYNTRLIDGSVNEDTGAYLSTGIEAIAKYGVCPESLWPYNPDEFSTPPPVSCYQAAEKRIITSYRQLDGVNDILEALSMGKPVPFGLAVFDGFMELDKNDAIIKIPDENQPVTGGHAMCMVGYDLPRQLFLAKNSFGVNWGDMGYCWIPFNYVRIAVFDVWVFDIPKLN